MSTPKDHEGDYDCEVCRNFANNAGEREYPTERDPWHPDCYIHQDVARVFQKGDRVVLDGGKASSVMLVKRVWSPMSIECVRVGGLGMTSYHPSRDLRLHPPLEGYVEVPRDQIKWARVGGVKVTKTWPVEIIREDENE